jgi:CHAT domain-containing protein
MRFILFLFSLAISFSSLGQEWLTLYQKAQTSYSSNQFETAYVEAGQALKRYQEEDGAANDAYASILRVLANVCFQQEKLEEGLGYAQKEIQIREGKKDLVLSAAFENTAQFHQEMGDYQKAIEQLARSKEVLLNFYSVDENPIVECELNMAINHYLANNNNQALLLFKDAFSRLKSEKIETLQSKYYFGLLNLEMGNAETALTVFSETQKKYQDSSIIETIDYALVVKGLAETQHQLKEYEKAEAAYQVSQVLFEKLEAVNDDEYLYLLNSRAINLEQLGKKELAESLFGIVAKHPEGRLPYAAALNNRAALLQAKGEFESAQKLYEESISKLDKTKKTESLLYAETLQNLALLQAERKQLEKAIQFIDESYSIIAGTLGEVHPSAINSLNKKASILYKANQTQQAKRDYEKVINTLASKPSHEMAVALIGLAQCIQKEAKYVAADSIYRVAIGYYDAGQLNKDDQFITVLASYASLLQEEGQLKEASATMQKALVQLKKTKGIQHEYYPILLENIASLHLRLGKRELAKVKLDSAEAFFDSEKKMNSEAYGAMLLGKGRYHQVSGEYQKAELYLRKGTDLFLKLNGERSESYAFAINSLALYYQTMGNFPEAEPLFTKALAIREQTNGKVSTEYATVLQNLASLYQLQENYQKAEPLLQEANKIDEAVLGNKNPQYLVSLQNLATLYQKKKDLEKAAFMMETVRSLTEKIVGKNHPSYVTVISNIASLYQDQGKYAESEALWKESVNLRKSMLGEDHPDYARSLYGLAGVYYATGKFAEAAPHFTSVVEKYQRQITTYFDALSEKEKSAFYNRIKPVFESYQDFCVQLINQKSANEGVIEKLYDIQLSTKAILLNASNKVRNAIMNSGDVELQNLFRQWQATKEELVRSYSLTTEERTRLKIDLVKEEEKANDLEKNLSARSSQFALGKKNVTWKEVKASLKPNETAIEIIRIKKKYVPDSIYYAALIVSATSEKPQLFIWPEGDKLENKWYKYHRNAIKFHFRDTISFKHFWSPLLTILPASRTLFISCDGVFNKINLNCIENPYTNKWAIDEFNIRLVSNTRELTESHSSMKTSSNQASIFGYADFNLTATNQVIASTGGKRASRYGFQGEEIPMLPATKKEVNLLNEALTAKAWKTSSFTLLDATEENFKKINNPQILHIATHGFFLNDVDVNDDLESNEESQLAKNPLFRSGILLAGAGLQQTGTQEDGVLTAYEAMNLTLDNTELVSLSACETGLGDVRNGEGVYGLQRSFLVAGARTVIMSLWQVDDEATQELMSTFYTQWINGMDKFQAFRAAQLAIKEKYKLPYYWGAFVMIGN